MSLKGTTLSKEGLEYLCGLINKIVSAPKDLLDDINLATNTTFSSVRIDSLIADTLQQANTHAEALCNTLTKLTCEKTTTQPTLSNSEKNVIYLYSSDGNAPFDQYLKISDTELIDLGNTSISLNDYLTITDAVATYCKKTDFDALKTEVTNLKTKVGTDTLNTTSQDLSGGVNELKTDLTKHTGDTNIHVTTSDKTKWNEVDNKVNKTDITTTIDSSSTDTQVPSAKSVYDKVGKYKIYHGSDLGITNSTTLPEMVQLMPDYSILYVNWNPDLMASNSKWYSEDVSYGILEIVRNTSGFIRLEHTFLNRKFFFEGNITGVTGNIMFLTKVCTANISNVDWTSANKTSVLSKGDIKYRVKNGVCFVSVIDIMSATMSTKDQIIATGLPIPETGLTSINSWFVVGSSSSTSYKPLLVKIKSDGSVANFIGDDNVAYFGTFSYPVKEQ